MASYKYNYCIGFLVCAYQGLKNKGMMSNEDIEAYKYAFSQPGAVTPPINYYRNVFSYPRPASELIDIPTLLIWVSIISFVVLYLTYVYLK